jgi:peptidoglycan/xylan/chitin deacetylase (PgdA/CDA1 family)
MRRAVSLPLGLTGAAGLAYWRHLSPYSQALGAFPARATDRPDPPRVALSFDDGPNEPFTSAIAAVLEAREVRGTFFQVGRCVQRQPEVTAALAAAGHVIGNHSHSHRWTRGWRTADLRDEVARAEEAIAEELGRIPLLYRPPWLLRNANLFRVLAERGLRPVSGEFCHPLEPLQPPAARLAHRAVRRSRPGRILIFHDGYDAHGADRASTVDAVARVVDTLLARGDRLVTVDELLAVPAYRLPAGARPREGC